MVLVLLACFNTGPEAQNGALSPGNEGPDVGAEAPFSVVFLPPSFPDAEEPEEDCPDELAWKLNVVSLGNIGTAARAYGSDFEGGAAVLGSAWFEGFSLNDVSEVDLPYSLYTGGRATLYSGAFENGGIESAGDVWISSGSVAGDIVSGGSLAGTTGTVDGDVFLGGVDESSLSVSGILSEGVLFTPSLDLEALGDYFVALSERRAASAPTTTANEVFGELQIQVLPGENVVEISGEELAQAWGVSIDGPAEAEVVLNVADEQVSFSSLVWSYSGGVTPATTLLNLHGADRLDLSGGNHDVAILAPFADTTFPHGLVTGSLIVGSLEGGGQVNTSIYAGDDCEDVPTGGGPS